MKLTKKVNPDGTITLSWEKIPGVDGFRFYSAGKFRSDTWDANRTSVKFSAGQEPYVVEAIRSTGYAVVDTGRLPAAAPPPPPPPPPPPIGLAPQSYNKGSNGQDARYNIRINVTNGVDGGGFRYDDGGRSLGGRSGKFVDGLKPSDSMDGKEPWDPYVGPNGTILPPYPPASYEV